MKELLIQMIHLHLDEMAKIPKNKKVPNHLHDQKLALKYLQRLLRVTDKEIFLSRQNKDLKNYVG